MTNPVILREYDIRGTFGKTLFATDAIWLGERFGSFIKNQRGSKIVIGCDGRKSSPLLRQALINGLLSTGITVIDIGLCPTPMSYFAGHYLKANATVMVTGSHNPIDDNGFKLTFQNLPFFANQIQNLKTQPVVVQPGGKYIDEAAEVFKAYLSHLLKHNFKKPFKIAWDTGNGAAGPIVEALTQALPEHEHILMFTEVDGSFPNHHPNPSEAENLVDLRKTVLEQACDLGFAFDGDGDRIAVIDSKGRVISGEQLILIISQEILRTAPGSTIIFDVKCSDMLFTEITALNGRPLMVKTGHAWIKEAMHAHDAMFAGEMSGHMFFKHNGFGLDDGLYAAVFLLNYLQKIPESLDCLVDQMPKQFSTPELRIWCEEEEKFQIIEDLKQNLQARDKSFSTIDGVRVQSDKGWWLVRASNTQNALIIRAEAKTQADLDLLLTEIKGYNYSLLKCFGNLNRF